MDFSKAKREMEIQCWQNQKTQLKTELTMLQDSMVADVSNWNEDNTSRCALLISNVKHIESKLQVNAYTDLVSGDKVLTCAGT